MPSAPVEDRLGVFSVSGDLGLEWKHNAFVSYSNDDWNVTFTQLYRDGYMNQQLPGIANGTAPTGSTLSFRRSGTTVAAAGQSMTAYALATALHKHYAEDELAAVGLTPVPAHGVAPPESADSHGTRAPHRCFANRGLEPIYRPDRVMQVFSAIAAANPASPAVTAVAVAAPAVAAVEPHAPAVDASTCRPRSSTR